MTKIKITLGKDAFTADLFINLTANAILKDLPIKAKVNRWGDEIYFPIPLHLKLEKAAKSDVEVGDLAYWPYGPAFCIFYGKTPASTGEKPKAYSPVNVFGHIKGDLSILRKNTTQEITIEKS